MDRTEKFLHWKESQGKTLVQIANEMNFGVPYLSRIASGERQISDSFLWRFQAAYGVDVTQQVFGNGTELIPYEAAQ